jgi:hypothetical protein
MRSQVPQEGDENCQPDGRLNVYDIPGASHIRVPG